MAQKQLKKRLSRINLEEFRAIVMNLVLMTLEQAEWISNEAERILYEHTELREKLEEWDEDYEMRIKPTCRVGNSYKRRLF